MRNKSKTIMTLVSLAIMFLFRFIPAPAGLTVMGMQVIGIFIGTMLLWNFEGIEWPSFLCIVLLVIYQIMEPAQLFETGMGNSIVNFLMVFFMLSYALSQVGFSKRLAIACISNPLARTSPWAFTTMFLFSTVLLASLMSQTAAALVFLPIAEQIFKEVGYKKGERFPQMLVLGIGIAVGIGSANTPLGHTIILIPMQLLLNNFNISLNIITYSIFGFATGLVIFAVLMLIYRFIYRPDIEKLRNFDVASLRSELEPMTLQEKIASTAFFTVILVWILQGCLKGIWPAGGTYLNYLGNAIPAMVAIVILCIWKIGGKPIMDFKDAAMKGVPWTGILFTASVMILSSALTLKEVGISEFLISTVTPLVSNLSPMIFILVITVLCVLVTNIASNTVVVTVFFSIAAPIAAAMGTVNLATLAALIGAAASYAYATPPATMPMAVIAGTGWVDTKAMLKYGGMMAIVSMVALVLVGYPLANLLF